MLCFYFQLGFPIKQWLQIYSYQPEGKNPIMLKYSVPQPYEQRKAREGQLLIFLFRGEGDGEIKLTKWNFHKSENSGSNGETTALGAASSLMRPDWQCPGVMTLGPGLRKTLAQRPKEATGMWTVPRSSPTGYRCCSSWLSQNTSNHSNSGDRVRSTRTCVPMTHCMCPTSSNTPGRVRGAPCYFCDKTRTQPPCMHSWVTTSPPPGQALLLKGHGLFMSKLSKLQSHGWRAKDLK